MSPLSVVSVSATDSTVLRIQFMDCWPVSADCSQIPTAAKIHLLVSCKPGTIYKITTGRGLQSCTAQLTERSSDFCKLTYLLNVSNLSCCQVKRRQNISVHYFLYLSRPEHNRHLPTVTTLVPFLQNLVETLKLLINLKLFIQKELL